MSSGKFWNTEPNGFIEPIIGKSGYEAEKPVTVVEVFKRTVEKHGNERALCLKRRIGDGPIPSEWKVWTWKNYWDECVVFAKALVHLNVSPFTIVNIIGFNSPEWFISNSGAIMAGCIAAGIYSTNTPDAVHYVSEHSKAEIVTLEDNKQLEKYAKMVKSKLALPHLKAIVVWGEPINESIRKEINVPVYTWAEFMALGVSVPDEVVSTRNQMVLPGHCSTLIYTSGTTGPPKAVMISHDNVTWTTSVMCQAYMDLNHNDRLCSYLPLSHIAAQLIDLHIPMNLGGATYFCQPDALKGSLTKTLVDVKPTIFFGVPRVWEKIQEKMVQMGRETKGIKKSLSTWAKSMGAQHSELAQYGNAGGAPCGYSCANFLILSKIKGALGLDCTKACFTAAAPIAPEVLRYFASLDIPVFEVFGQSECTGPHTVSCVGQWKIGYCGRPLHGTQSMVAEGTKELCYRGRHIFMGYMYMPEKTAETIDEEGYLHSGDIGEFDDNDVPTIPKPSGFMKITGRIKELIITAGGENIPPVLIENEMKAAMNAVSNCMVIGDQRKFLTMLLSVKTEPDKDSGAPTNILSADSVNVCKQIGSTAVTVNDVMNDELWTKYFNDGMKLGNSKTTSAAQKIQKWKLLPVDFSEKAGELTPTLKLKRNVVNEKYAVLIDSLYADSNNE